MTKPASRPRSAAAGGSASAGPPSRGLRLVMSRIEADEFVSELSPGWDLRSRRVSRLQAPITTLPTMAGSGNFALSGCLPSTGALSSQPLATNATRPRTAVRIGLTPCHIELSHELTRGSATKLRCLRKVVYPELRTNRPRFPPKPTLLADRQ